MPKLKRPPSPLIARANICGASLAEKHEGYIRKLCTGFCGDMLDRDDAFQIVALALCQAEAAGRYKYIGAHEELAFVKRVAREELNRELVREREQRGVLVALLEVETMRISMLAEEREADAPPPGLAEQLENHRQGRSRARMVLKDRLKKRRRRERTRQ